MRINLYHFATVILAILVVSLFQNCGSTGEVKSYQFKKQEPGDWVDKAKKIEGDLLSLNVALSLEPYGHYYVGGDNVRLERTGQAFRTLSGSEVELSSELQSEIRNVFATASICQFNYEFNDPNAIRCMAIGVTYASATIESFGQSLQYQLAPSICDAPSVDFCDDSQAAINDLIVKIRTAAAP